MTSFFPDVNVWMALSVRGHVHNESAVRWLQTARRSDRLIFSRFTQLGFMRLLTTSAVMQERTLTILAAWKAFDAWMSDPRVEFHPEPPSVGTALRQATAPFSRQTTPKAIGDCYLLAFARETNSTLVTFDRALASVAEQMQHRLIVPD